MPEDPHRAARETVEGVHGCAVLAANVLSLGKLNNDKETGIEKLVGLVREQTFPLRPEKAKEHFASGGPRSRQRYESGKHDFTPEPHDAVVEDAQDLGLLLRKLNARPPAKTCTLSTPRAARRSDNVNRCAHEADHSDGHTGGRSVPHARGPCCPQRLVES